MNRCFDPPPETPEGAWLRFLAGSRDALSRHVQGQYLAPGLGRRCLVFIDSAPSERERAAFAFAEMAGYIDAAPSEWLRHNETFPEAKLLEFRTTDAGQQHLWRWLTRTGQAEKLVALTRRERADFEGDREE